MSGIEGLHILLVEDDPDLNEALADHLGLEGAKVDSTFNGKEALEKIRLNNYAFIISDMRMPNGDGRFLAKELLKIENSPKLFVYSGFNDLTDSEIKELKIVKAFTKPIVFEELIVEILKSL
jgi:DNA-binding response OmpR family regulator